MDWNLASRERTILVTRHDRDVPGWTYDGTSVTRVPSDFSWNGLWDGWVLSSKKRRFRHGSRILTGERVASDVNRAAIRRMRVLRALAENTVSITLTDGLASDELPVFLCDRCEPSPFTVHAVVQFCARTLGNLPHTIGAISSGYTFRLPILQTIAPREEMEQLALSTELFQGLCLPVSVGGYTERESVVGVVMLGDRVDSSSFHVCLQLLDDPGGIIAGMPITQTVYWNENGVSKSHSGQIGVILAVS